MRALMAENVPFTHPKLLRKIRIHIQPTSCKVELISCDSTTKKKSKLSMCLKALNASLFELHHTNTCISVGDKLIKLVYDVSISCFQLISIHSLQ